MKAVVDMLASHAAAELLHGLLRAGVLDDLRSPCTAAEVAAPRGLDPTGAEAVLEFLARTTGLVERRRGRFALQPWAIHSTAWRALLEKHVGAYGPAVRNPLACLRAPEQAGAAIDLAALTRAFAADDESQAVVDIIMRLEPSGVLDLGCGQGALLARVCRDSTIRGWGIDRSETMCRAARRRLAASGLRDQVTIRCASALAAGRRLKASERERVDVLYAASLFNEWMADDAIAVAALRRLGASFPGRSLVVVDYLGALGRKRRAGRYTYLTDLVQSLTGQGVPPATHGGWERIYRAAGARLIDASEASTCDLRYFVHVVALPGPAD